MAETLLLTHQVQISGLIMTLNEKQFIGECIEHHKQYVDEIIVLDHGSTDNTVEIAKAHGAKVTVEEIEYPSDRRNRMHELATYDWCLHIDADELFESWFLERMKIMIHRDIDRDIFYIGRYNLPFGKNWPDRQPRLLNKNVVGWYRKIHEIVCLIGEEKPYDQDYSERIIIVDGPMILHRITDRDTESRVARLKHWKTLLIKKPELFDDIEAELNHIDEEIQECRELR